MPIKQASASPPPLVVVIPCHQEPDILTTLRSLAQCAPPAWPVELIVVLNAANTASAETLELHQARKQELLAWSEPAPFRLQLLDYPDLPAKHAGVGLARRLGMDLAAEHLLAAKQPQGVIVNLDADCTVAPNYFQALEAHFQQKPETPGASIYFEHPLSGHLDPRLYEGITYYELFLRYYVHGLRYAGLPCAFQTIGSAMAVRAEVYLQQGGMNRRKAGEDFYFLQKIIELGGFSEVRTTCVYPSPRLSLRVPFGTGKAMGDWLRQVEPGYAADPLQGFLDLKQMGETLPAWPVTTLLGQHWLETLSQPLQAFLSSQACVAKLVEISCNSASPASFRKRFFLWFNGFRAMKCLHELRDQAYGHSELLSASAELLELAWQIREPLAARTLLERFRQLDKAVN